jgi:hypothetical protein
MTFELNNKTYTKLPVSGERSIELPVVWDEVQAARAAGKRVLEVGNCLQPYYKSDHVVLDVVEKHPWVLNQDVETYNDGQFDLIASISTFEHIGQAQYGQAFDPQKLWRCIRHCTEDLLAPGGMFLLTWPWGANRDLDSAIWENRRLLMTWRVMLRVQHDLWVEADKELLRTVRYGRPFKFANALVFAWWVKKPDAVSLKEAAPAPEQVSAVPWLFRG